MESFGLIGFVMGSTGMTFAILAWTQAANLHKELSDLKERLVGSGVLSHESTRASSRS